MAVLTIIPIQFESNGLLSVLCDEISLQTNLQTRIIRIDFNPSYAYNPARGQYHSTQLLSGLNRLDIQSDKILGVTELDLFIPILTYVFGEAQLNGPAAIVSAYRLFPEFYGLPPDVSLVQLRLIKEAIHELGHTFGLKHCTNYGCVLNVSTYVEEIDLKSHRFCGQCQKTLRESKVDPST
jgi:archaemetzincin